MRGLIARLLHLASLWVGVVGATFVLFFLVPTDPARTMLGVNAPEAQVHQLRRDLGLDKPVTVQFTRYVRDVLFLDMGRSYVDGRQVAPEVFTRLRLTVALTVLAAAIAFTYVFLSLLFGLRFGALCEITDFACVSLPTLFSAMLIVLLAIHYYPFTRFAGTYSLDDWMYLLPPALVLALYPMGVLGRVARSQLRTLDQATFVRNARALGLGPYEVLTRFLMRNAAIPLLAVFSVQLPLMITNTFVVEVVFSVPGIGSLLLHSVLERDLPMLAGIVVVTSLTVLVINMFVELVCPLLDPRIRGDHES